MNLRDLQYLTVIAEEMNFGRAAARCNVSQSTLSIQIKKLEDTLGVQLFERTNKHVMLTEVGEKICARAKHILQQSDEIRQFARESRDPLAGDLTLGAFPTLAPYLFPKCLDAIKHALPKIRLRLIEEKTSALLEMLGQGKIDCALIAAPVAQRDITSVPLFREPFFIAAPAGHAVAKKKSISNDELSRLDLLLLDEGHCLRTQALEICHSIGKGEASKFRATSLETLRQMVALGEAVTLMPRLAVHPDDTKISYIPLQDPSFGRTITLCCRTTSARQPLFEILGKSISGSV